MTPVPNIYIAINFSLSIQNFDSRLYLESKHFFMHTFEILGKH